MLPLPWLRRRADFARVRTAGRVFRGDTLHFRVAPGAESSARLGIIAPRALGNAVVRNRFKRWVRVAWREVNANFPVVDIVAAPNLSHRPRSLADVRSGFARLISYLRPISGVPS